MPHEVEKPLVCSSLRVGMKQDNTVTMSGPHNGSYRDKQCTLPDDKLEPPRAKTSGAGRVVGVVGGVGWVGRWGNGGVMVG